MTAADDAVIDRWWATFVATGRLPAELTAVQGRLVRAVHRGSLPSGDVYVKVMTFPRTKDKVRYLLRSLPAAHEAAMLRATAAAGIPCPEVVAVRTARRRGIPHRSLLVLRALPTATAATTSTSTSADEVSLREEATIAAQLLAANLVHHDLHSGNFVRLTDGRTAVLDLQSVRRGAPSSARRLAAAAKLLQNRSEITRAAAATALLDSALLRSPDDVDRALARAAAGRLHHLRGRILRCWTESTEFTRRRAWWGIEHRTRGELPPGRWWSGATAPHHVWVGQRARFVLDGRPPAFPAIARKWWWLGGGASLYVPASCSDERIEAEVATALAGHERFRALSLPVPIDRQ